MKGIVMGVLMLFMAMSTYSPSMVKAQSVNQTRLRIVVPSKSGFNQFVNIERSSVDGQRNYTGFAIEVFNEAVIATVDKSITFDFVPFERDDGTMNGTYDDMVEAVFNKEYDGVVGDVTIRFSRTQWVDFTIPYTETGISMLIPKSQQFEDRSTPLISPIMLIGTIVCFFFSLAILLLVLIPWKRSNNHKLTQVNRYLMGKTMGTTRGTTMMMLLCFMILLYVISYYGATLTWLLTRGESKLPNKDIYELIRNREKVGYPHRSFVYDLLKEVGFSDYQLFPYDSEPELLDMFNKGNGDGGVTIAIDETPAFSVLLAQHCNNFSLVSIPSLRSSGFGFAFPIGSPLVREVSNGIIKLIDNGNLARIQRRTTGVVGTCDDDQTIQTNSINIANPHIIRSFEAGGFILLVSLLAICVLACVRIPVEERRDDEGQAVYWI